MTNDALDFARATVQCDCAFVGRLPFGSRTHVSEPPRRLRVVDVQAHDCRVYAAAAASVTQYEARRHSRLVNGWRDHMRMQLVVVVNEAMLPRVRACRVGPCRGSG